MVAWTLRDGSDCSEIVWVMKDECFCCGDVGFGDWWSYRGVTVPGVGCTARLRQCQRLRLSPAPITVDSLGIFLTQGSSVHTLIKSQREIEQGWDMQFWRISTQSLTICLGFRGGLWLGQCRSFLQHKQMVTDRVRDGMDHYWTL